MPLTAWRAGGPWLPGLAVAGHLLLRVRILAWIAFLSLVPLSDGVLLGSINIVAVMVAGRLLFGERLTGLRVAGILLVSLGVAVVGAGT
jgi:drug/metabolite transporter (DMT)-like permease